MKKNKRLGVNIDHIATIQRLRDTPYPNLLQSAYLCQQGGAEQITVHLREDRRHIVDQDVRSLKNDLKIDLNLEMAATDEMLNFSLEVRPFSVCIVPEKREEKTTEGGLDLKNPSIKKMIQKICTQTKTNGILPSLFIEPSIHDVQSSLELGAGAIELHTGALCIAHQKNNVTAFNEELKRVRNAAALGAELGLKVHAGHGIDFATAKILGEIEQITEFNIGHSIVAYSTVCGLKVATQKMLHALQGNIITLESL